MKFSSKICPKIKIYNLLYLVILSVKLRERERERSFSCTRERYTWLDQPRSELVIMIILYILYQIFYAAFSLNKFMQTQNASSCLHANMEIRLVVSRMEHIFWEISSVIKIFINFAQIFLHLPWTSSTAIKRSCEDFKQAYIIIYYIYLIC